MVSRVVRGVPCAYAWSPDLAEVPSTGIRKGLRLERHMGLPYIILSSSLCKSTQRYVLHVDPLAHLPTQGGADEVVPHHI